jgi:glycosyltransferase involved in cell wall biosynthesis
MASPDVPPYNGGISRIVDILEKGLTDLGHTVTLVNPRLRVKELKFSRIPFYQYKGRFDVVHLHGPTPFLSDLMLLTNTRIPIVYTHHAEVSWISEGLSKIYRDLHKYLAKRARIVIVHSYDYADLFKKTNVTVVHMPCSFELQNGFDIERKPDRFTVLYVGQMRPFKGAEVLIRAAFALRHIYFVFVGEGYLKPKLKKMAENLKNVKFLGATSDEELKELYKQSHVICLPSVNTTEAYGLTLMEGALFGCVPLASDLIGVRENVTQLRGLVFTPGSHVALAEKLRKLSSDYGLWLRIAKQSRNAAHNYANTFTPDYYVRRHEGIFKNVVNTACS